MILASMKRYVPWWAKISAKLILSRMPVNYSIWKRLGIFAHGQMDQASYAVNVFDMHVARAGLRDKLANKTILELGPGDSVALALIAKSLGARSILVDTDAFAAKDTRPYHALAKILRQNGLSVPDLGKVDSLDEFLECCDAKYMTSGIDSLREISNCSVDFIYSQAVVEHIPKAQIFEVMCELVRILKPDGICSHRVDLRDHLGGGLNNLRFSQKIWESKFFSRSGFYTNRIQFMSMLKMFRRAGFNVDVKKVDRWESLPIKREHLAPEFRNISESDLLVSGFDVLLRK